MKKSDPSLLMQLVIEWRDIARTLKDIPEQRPLKAAYMNCAGMLESRLSSPTPSHTEAVPVGWLRADGRFERGTELVSKHPGDAVGAIPLFSIPQPPAIDAETIQAAALEIEGMYYRTGVEAILGDVRLERVRGILNKHITHQEGEK